MTSLESFQIKNILRFILRKWANIILCGKKYRAIGEEKGTDLFFT